MIPLRRFGGLDFLLLVLVLAVAAGARAAYLASCADGGRSAGPLLVQDPLPPLPGWPADEQMRGRKDPTDLDALAHNVKEHLWFGSLAPFAPAEEATAHVAPGYPWLLGLIGRFVEPPSVDYLVRWLQAGLGALTAGLYFLFARRAFRSLFVGALAGLLAAVYPFWILNTATIDDGILATFLLAAVVFLGARAVQTSGPFASLLYGLALAGLALVRAALVPFAFVALAWFLLRSRRVPRGWLCALVAFLGFATGLAPWSLRNFRRFNEPVPVASSAHLHLWIGNNPRATGGPATESILEIAPAQQLLAIENQPDRYAKLGQDWWSTVREDPLSTVQRRFWATQFFLFGERWFKEQQLAEERTSDAERMPAWLGSSYAPVLLSSLLALFLFAFLGWRWTFGWAAEAMPSALAVVWVPLPYLLSHAEALHGPRLPLDGVLLCYAAFAVACLIPGSGGRLLRGAADGRGDEER